MLPITRHRGSRGPFNPFTSGLGTVVTQEETTLDAVVVDVIVNDSHTEYSSDGYNVGAIKFRFIKSNQYREEGLLNWAFPAESNLSDYPLLNEIVVITRSLNRFYYTKKVNTSNRVTAQALHGVNEELSTIPKPGNKAKNYQASTANAVKSSDTAAEKLGAYFIDNKKVFRLRHDEGDIILEGRSGQSIRMGAAWKKTSNFRSTETDQSPNLLFRVGPSPTAPTVTSPFGLVVEDINLDKTSMWMVSDQLVPLKYSTLTGGVHKASVPDFPNRLEGNQIVMNTDRFVINTKKDKILGHSMNGIHWTTNRDFTVDAARDYASKVLRDKKLSIGRNAVFTVGGYHEITAKQHVSLIAPKVYLGSASDESQPVPLGADLIQFLSDLIDAQLSVAATFVTTSSGPGALNPGLIAKLTALKSKVTGGAHAKLNSKVTFTR